MDRLENDTIQALNALLEDQRANVEILVELASGATEVAERIACTTMGAEAVLMSCDLRERLTALGVPVTRRINGIALHILNTERYDERLHAFARHQADVSERAQTLLESLDEREMRAALSELHEAGVRGALWCEQRAATFAATRFLEFHPNRPTLLRPRAIATASETESSDAEAHPPFPSVEPGAHQENGASNQEDASAVNGDDTALPADLPQSDGADAD